MILCGEPDPQESDPSRLRTRFILFVVLNNTENNILESGYQEVNLNYCMGRAVGAETPITSQFLSFFCSSLPQRIFFRRLSFFLQFFFRHFTFPFFFIFPSSWVANTQTNDWTTWVIKSQLII